MNVLWTRLVKNFISTPTMNLRHELSNSIIFPKIMDPVNYNKSCFIQKRFCECIEELRKQYLKKLAKPKPVSKNPLGPKPCAKAIVIKTLIKKPRKPNSANRKCVLVKLSNGVEKIAFVPGEGHNLQEHQIVLVYPKRLKDVPGVKIRCVRGKYDLPHVKKKEEI